LLNDGEKNIDAFALIVVKPFVIELLVVDLVIVDGSGRLEKSMPKTLKEVRTTIAGKVASIKIMAIGLF